MRRPRAWIGKFLVAIGIVHLAFGLVFLRSLLAPLWSEGLVNTVNGQPEREFPFWFLSFGALAVILGLLVDWCERRWSELPWFLGASLLALTAAMLVVMPISGAWLVLIPAIGALLRSRR